MLVPGSDAAALRDELRAAGLRATASRTAVLHALRAAAGPLSHGEMEQRLRQGPWNRTTVYRNLLDLARVGLAHRFDVGDHVWRFEAALDRHPHFVCDSCGDIACLDGVELAVAPRQPGPRALRARDVEIRVVGVCDRCS